MEKLRMFYPRTFRRFSLERKKQWFFLLLIALPVLLLVLFGFPWLTEQLARLSLAVLSPFFPPDSFSVASSDFISDIADVSFVTLFTLLPTMKFAFVNLVVALILLFLCLTVVNRRGKSLSIYLSINVIIFLLGCVFFILTPESFPYTAAEYSELYIKQQVGILIAITAISGVIITFQTAGKSLWRIATFLSIVIYSLCFGLSRYIAFLFIIGKCSILYVPTMFFTLGPFFDFLYVVFLYSVFSEKLIKSSSSIEGRSVWKWF